MLVKMLIRGGLLCSARPKVGVRAKGGKTSMGSATVGDDLVRNHFWAWAGLAADAGSCPLGPLGSWISDILVSPSASRADQVTTASARGRSNRSILLPSGRSD